MFSISGSELSIHLGRCAPPFASAPDYRDEVILLVTVTAVTGPNSSTQEITVTITDVDDVAPVFTSSATFGAAENQTYRFGTMWPRIRIQTILNCV